MSLFPFLLSRIDLFFVLYKGLKNTAAKEFPLYASLPVSFGIGVVCGCLWIWPFGPKLRERIEAKSAEQSADDAKNRDATERVKDSPDMDSENEDVESPQEKEPNPSKHGTTSSSNEGDEAEMDEEAKKSYLKRMARKFADSTYKQDLHQQSMDESSRANELWDADEKFDPNAEQLFTYIQVFTACLNAFAHGANDVSNAIAPLSAIIIIYQSGEIESKAPVQKWVLAYGGIGIVLGLLIYGYKVMKSIGYKLCALSPSRAASGGLAASLFVVTASFLGIPVSSTQCIVGGLSGVGLVGGIRNVQWLFLGKVAVGWVLIFAFSALLSAGLFAICAYSPSLAA